jgi:hypothetical protein
MTIFVVHFLCSPKENEPKERAPCHSVLRTSLCFSKDPELEETRFAQTVHELNPDLSAMLDLVTTGIKNELRGSFVITCPPRGGFLRPPALQAAESHSTLHSRLDVMNWTASEKYGMIS